MHDCHEFNERVISFELSCSIAQRLAQGLQPECAAVADSTPWGDSRGIVFSAVLVVCEGKPTTVRARGSENTGAREGD